MQAAYHALLDASLRAYTHETQGFPAPPPVSRKLVHYDANTYWSMDCHGRMVPNATPNGPTLTGYPARYMHGDGMGLDPTQLPRIAGEAPSRRTGNLLKSTAARLARAEAAAAGVGLGGASDGGDDKPESDSDGDDEAGGEGKTAPPARRLGRILRRGRRRLRARHSSRSASTQPVPGARGIGNERSADRCNSDGHGEAGGGGGGKDGGVQDEDDKTDGVGGCDGSEAESSVLIEQEAVRVLRAAARRWRGKGGKMGKKAKERRKNKQ